ncbi:glycoside hydrolase 3 protein [Coemansia spiralis]|uniref:glucan endo-1,3-beta-D-glucosidase n=2 Tax=Coemansia TaxID=4863 RepID=A0A9W8G9M2_9FUNG|nr:glycoside hydrolase superfamily [Coemansia spiralis]KAJ1992889.1 glycoside hydrolase 3 protein [Coemansia umbellata]KAJ2622823.1 glycoside hydrolase 3 protein [Coemansia sp. RSA 1358]KAJ2678030.1 glycoside hydrolase 3 protein [Coemansia spiralis]
MRLSFSLLALASTVLGASQFHGLNYNPKRQDGSCPNVYQVQADLKVLRPYTNKLRIYSVKDCNQGEPVLRAMQNTDWKVELGLWVDSNDASYEADKQELIRLAGVFNFTQQVNAVVVGSEAIYRGEQTAEQLASKVGEIKAVLAQLGLQGIPVTSSETWPTYYQPLIDAVDFVNMHGFPFWEGVAIDGAVDRMFEHIHTLQRAANGKKVVVGETGWPSAGDNYGAAVTGVATAQRYLQQFVCRAIAEDIDYYYFNSFDQSWASTNNASNVEGHWGIVLDDYVTPKFSEPIYTCGGSASASASADESAYTSADGPSSAAAGGGTGASGSGSKCRGTIQRRRRRRRFV